MEKPSCVGMEQDPLCDFVEYWSLYFFPIQISYVLLKLTGYQALAMDT